MAIKKTENADYERGFADGFESARKHPEFKTYSEMLDRGAELILLDALEELKDYFVLDDDGMISRREDQETQLTSD